MRSSRSVRAVLVAYEKGYRVTDAGDVLSPLGRTLKLNGTAYKRFSVADPPGKPLKVRVHQLAGYQWFGSRALASGHMVRHLDGRGHNNHRGNLAVGTPHDNIMDTPGHVRRAHALKAARTRRRLTFAQAEELRRKRVEGASYRLLCVEYGLCKSLVSYIVNRRTYVCGE